MKSPVYVYKGPGASEIGTEHFLSALRSNLSSTHYAVEQIAPEDFHNGNKLAGAALVAFGSGYTSGFAAALGDDGIKNLKDYVTGGGSYLGIGAGGYFGCDFTEFDKGGKMEKVLERDLRFYPGVGRGPVYPGFQYGTNNGAHAVPLHFSNDFFSSSFDAFIDGGCAFFPSSPEKPGSEVKEVLDIARFTGLSGSPAAIVKTVVGKNGVSVLSGVHVELDVLSIIDSDPQLEHLRETCINSKASQELAFKSLLRLLNLNVV